MKDSFRKDLLQRRMSRKEFLAIIGSSMLVLFGFAKFISLFQNGHTTDASHGFGSRKFGG